MNRSGQRTLRDETFYRAEDNSKISVVGNNRKRFATGVLKPFAFFIAIGLTALAGQIRAANAVVAWGAGNFIADPPDYNNYGQSIVPTNATDATFVAAGGHCTLVVNTNGSLTGWGDDSFGQLIFFPSVSNYISTACGWQHCLALHSNGTVAAAGDSYYFQTDVPVGLSNVVAIAAGFYHSLALKSDGTVVAWGMSTNDSQIGVDPNYGQTRVPSNLSNVVAIAGGGWHSLALKSDGTVQGWGRDDYGQADTIGLSNIVAISAGAVHSLALRGDGTVVAWGADNYGQTNVPPGLSNVVAIAAGGWHNLALRNDGKVFAWGAGQGTNANVDFGQNIVPVSLSSVVQIAAGAVHSVALVGAHPPVTSILLSEFGFGTNGFNVSIPTRFGKVYQLEYTESLTNTMWMPLPLASGVNAAITLSDPAPATTQRFYRVREW